MPEMLELLSKASLPDEAVSASSVDDQLSKISSNLECTLSTTEKEEFGKAQAAVSFLGLVRNDLNSQQSLRTVGRMECGPESTWVSSVAGIAGEVSDFTELGRFEIVKAIGQGGFAKVFLAIDPLLDRQVALKIPKPHVLFSVEARERFQREAKAAAVLSHPSIVPVFESGSFGPITYIASGYCPGPTLAEWINENGDSIEPVISAQIMIRLADAIQHAHQRGVIHRDLKPANILVEDGESPIDERVRITDFGLAKQLEADDSGISVCGEVVGTPAYMSPEQAIGSPSIDGQTDIFSLGAIFYELLTGKIPFKRSNNLLTLRAVETESPARPRQLNSLVPKDLEAICLKCLAKDPSERYENAHSLARDLENAVAGRATVARPVTRTERMFRWAKRNPALAISQVCAFLFLVIGLTIATWQWQVISANLLVSNQQKDRAETNVSRLHNTVISVLDRYRNAIDNNVELTETDRQVVSDMLVVHKGLIDEEADQLSCTPETLAAYREIALLYTEIGQFEIALETCEQAHALVAIVAESDPAVANAMQDELLDIRIHEGAIANSRGYHETAELIYRDCIARLAQCEPMQEENVAKSFRMRVYRSLGLAFYGQRKMDKAAVAFEQGKKIATELVELEPENEFYQFAFGRSFQDVSNTYRTRGEPQEALDAVLTALDHFLEMADNEANTDDYRYRIAYLRSDAASIYKDLNKLDLAEQFIKLSLDQFHELIVEQPMSANIKNRLVHATVRHADVLEALGKYEEAVAVHEQGLVLVDSVAGEYMRLCRQLFFRSRFARLLHAQFDDPKRVDNLLVEAFEIGELGLKEFPNDSIARNRLAEAYSLSSLIAEEKQNDELSLELAWKAAELRFVVLQFAPRNRSRRKMAVSAMGKVVDKECLVGNFDRATECLINLEQACPKSGFIQYSVGRTRARLAQLQRDSQRPEVEVEANRSLAIAHLRTAIELGFSKLKWLEQHPEWDSVRDSKEFINLISSAQRD